MKTRFGQIAAITFFALFISVGNASADGIEKSASSHENMEESLEIENWMVNENLWDVDDLVTIESTTDETLELEDWMLDNKTWGMENTIELETEEALVVESWMTDENTWNK